MKVNKIIWLVLIIPVLLLIYNLSNHKNVVTVVATFNPGLASNTTGYSSQTQLINSIYDSNESIVADFVIDSNYINGNISATNVINNALQKCGEKGGGTVYLPAGKYLIDGQINVPDGCTLRGDYQDPDIVGKKSDLKYGTILMIDGNINKNYPGVIQLHSGSGAVGLTIFYTGLNLNNVNTLNNTWTFYYEDNSHAITFKDITFINANRGIGKYSYLKTMDQLKNQQKNDSNPYNNNISYSNVDDHQILHIENVKGTFLNTGIAIINSSEVGTMDNVTMSPKYWANANANVLGVSSLPTSEQITNFAKNNNSIGLLLESVEQSQFNNVIINGHKYGIYAYERHIHNNAALSRASSSAEFFNLNITNVEYSIYADKNAIDRRYGFTISNSNLEGNIAINCSIINYSGAGYYMNGSSWIYSSNNSGQLFSIIKLYETNIKGTISGNGVVKYSNGKGTYKNITGSVNISNTNILEDVNETIITKTTSNNFIAVNAGASADTINQALNNIGNAGGGVVYLPAGEYIINKTLIVPANVELRGANAVANIYYGKPSSNPETLKGTPIGTVITINSNITAVVLGGDNAGVTGINIGYEKVIANINKGSNIYDPQNAGRACRGFVCYTAPGKNINISGTNNLVSIQAANVNHPYVSNVTIIGAMYGIEFNNCHDFVANNIVTSILSDGILITNSNLGTVRNMLQNGVILTENYFYPFKSSLVSLDTNLRNVIQITSDRYTALNINNSHDLLLENLFSYAGKNLIYAVKSSFYGINHEVDTSFAEVTQGIKNGYFMYSIDNETRGTISNIMSVGTVFYNAEPSKLSLFNLAYLNTNELKSAYSLSAADNIYGGFDFPNKYNQIYLLDINFNSYIGNIINIPNNSNNTYTVQFNVTNGTKPSNGTITYNSSKNFTSSPNSGYTFKSASCNNGTSITRNGTTFTVSDVPSTLTNGSIITCAIIYTDQSKPSTPTNITVFNPQVNAGTAVIYLRASGSTDTIDGANVKYQFKINGSWVAANINSKDLQLSWTLSSKTTIYNITGVRAVDKSGNVSNVLNVSKKLNVKRAYIWQLYTFLRSDTRKIIGQPSESEIDIWENNAVAAVIAYNMMAANPEATSNYNAIGASKYAARMYEGILGRTADSGGQAYVAGKGLKNGALFLVNSSEAQSIYSTWGIGAGTI